MKAQRRIDFPVAKSFRVVSVAVLIVTIPIAGSAAEIGTGDDLHVAINAMQPGDTLLLRGGTYALTARLSVQLACTVNNACVIRAKRGETLLIHRPNNDQNIIDLEQSSYLSFIGIEHHGFRSDCQQCSVCSKRSGYQCHDCIDVFV